MSKIFVFGHQNPDSDAIGSSYGYAYLKRQLGVEAEAVALGTPNEETAFVLDYFSVNAPRVVESARSEGVNQVILTDHNEFQQSISDIKDVEVIEVVDHHRVANFETANPLMMRLEPVGSASSIVYRMFKENNVEIPREIAGVMLSGILSDTLALTSPTTTDLDRQVVSSLAKIVDIDYQKYALDMFKAGTSLQGKTIEEIVNTDIKGFANDDLTFAVSQVFTLDIDSILARKEEYIDYINELAKNKEYRLVLLVVTDIIRNGSYLFYTDGSSEIISDGFDIIDMKQGTYVDGVVSRKKQVVPAIMDVIR